MAADPTMIPTPIPKPSVTQPAATYVQTQANGIWLGFDVPPGWKADKTPIGLMMMERYSSGQMTVGMQVHVFVYSTTGFDIPPGDHVNVALSVLDDISQQRQYVGDGTVSDPQGFQWDGHDAAYYLLNNGDGNVTMLLAVTTTTPQRLVVCNISTPDHYAQSIRVMLPNVLGNLTINGVPMDMTDVNNLPDPLVFPDYEPRPEETMDDTHKP